MVNYNLHYTAAFNNPAILHLTPESVIYSANVRYSNYFIPTLKEDPSDAEVVSQKLMIRAGMIRKVAAGVYNYLPLGLRCITKVENIVREEMNRAGAIEILMPPSSRPSSGRRAGAGITTARSSSASRTGPSANSASGRRTKRS